MRLIDADDFGNRMYHEVFEKDSEDQKWDSGCWMRYKLFERVLKEQPSAQPQRMKGRWVPHKSVFGGLGERVYACERCEYNIGFHKVNFCPNCGADMRE